MSARVWVSLYDLVLAATDYSAVARLLGYLIWIECFEVKVASAIVAEQ